MKAIPIYYTFQNDTDTTFNLLMMKHSFSNIDEVVINPIKIKIKVNLVLLELPISMDKQAYHFRFKTLSEEVEPKMMVWIDISNPNAKVPLIGNAVYVKILTLPHYGISKIYTRSRIHQFMNNPTVQQSTSKIEHNNNKQNTNANKQVFYNEQQKTLNNLLDDADDMKDFKNFTKVPQKVQDTRQVVLEEDDFDNFKKQDSTQKQVVLDEDDFDNFKSVPQQQIIKYQVYDHDTSQNVNQDQQMNHQKQVNSGSDLNLLGEEKYIMTREQLKEQNTKQVQEKIVLKVKELKEMWLSDENFDRWRSENKNEVEPKIIKWAFTDESRNQIRNMLAQLHEVLWENSGWEQCSIANLLTDTAVKNKYRDAIRIVHPDKNQEKDFKQRYISERVFFELNQAFNQHRQKK